MAPKISVVINALNEEKNIKRAIKSVLWAQEIVVCDMHSEDQTAKVAKQLGAKVILHDRMSYVEPARNFAISKASHEWILVLDPDEEVPETLKNKLIEIISNSPDFDYVRIPRKNLMFGHFMKNALWWPDLNIRFFKKGKVEWSNKIHRPPQTSGKGLDLPPEESFAITHHHYETISQFISRMNRYTDIQAQELQDEGYKFTWKDLIEKPLNEFLSRYFAGKGYQDGLHGLSLSLLQAFSFLIVYLKVWESLKFKEEDLSLSDLKSEAKVSGKAIKYWFNNENKNMLKKIYKIFKK